MKKRTNKILWITLIVIALLIIVPFTISFQIMCHRHPEVLESYSDKLDAESAFDLDSVYVKQVLSEYDSLAASSGEEEQNK